MVWGVVVGRSWRVKGEGTSLRRKKREEEEEEGLGNRLSAGVVFVRAASRRAVGRVCCEITGGTRCWRGWWMLAGSALVCTRQPSRWGRRPRGPLEGGGGGGGKAKGKAATTTTAALCNRRWNGESERGLHNA